MITHLFNAMRPLHHRNPGIFGVLGHAESLPRPYFGIIADGKLPSDATASDLLCLLYQLGTSPVPSSLSVVTTLPLSLLNWSVGKLNPVFKNAGCALRPDQTAPSAS